MHTLSKGIKIGLTGSIASGKSTALTCFKSHGFHVFSADDVVSQLYSDHAFINKVSAKFAWLVTNDHIDKQKLVVALKDDVFYKEYIQIVHHAVLEKMLVFLDKHHSDASVCEVPLLFEAGWQHYFDEVWCIVASDQSSKQRALDRGMSISTYEFLKSHQWNIEKKIKNAHVLVSNDSNKEDFILQLSQLIRERIV